MLIKKELLLSLKIKVYYKKRRLKFCLSLSSCIYTGEELNPQGCELKSSLVLNDE